MYALLVMQGKLISGASDRCIRVWDARSFVCEHVLLELSATILSVALASGHLFAGCQDGTLAVWRRGAGAGFEVLCAVPAHKGGIYATLGVEEQVITGAADSMLQVWSAPADGTSATGGAGGALPSTLPSGTAGGGGAPVRATAMLLGQDGEDPGGGVYALAHADGFVYSGHQGAFIRFWSLAERT